MRHLLSAVCATATVIAFAGGATAADILSQDDQAYELTVTTAGEEVKIVVPSKSDLRSVCSKSCEIKMPDGQSLSAGPNDILFIIDGQIIRYES